MNAQKILQRCLGKNEKQELGKEYCLLCGKKDDKCSCTEKEKDSYFKRNY